MIYLVKFGAKMDSPRCEHGDVKEDTVDDTDDEDGKEIPDMEDGKEDFTVTMNDKSLDSGSSALISIGMKFGSFDALESKIRLFEEKNYTKFWKREARTIESAKKRVQRHLNPKLKYYELKYACIHGGQKFRPKGKGDRNTS